MRKALAASEIFPWPAGPKDFPRGPRCGSSSRLSNPSAYPGSAEEICEETGAKLDIANVRKAMRRHGPTPKILQKIHINRGARGPFEADSAD